MKKSFILFILWAVTTVVLTCVYLLVMMNPGNVQSSMISWILYLCVGMITVSVMPLIRYNARVEGIKWLTVVAKVLLIAYSVHLAAGALFFVAMLLV
jgi:hypothetical protein